jgi:hypothetical protein
MNKIMGKVYIGTRDSSQYLHVFVQDGRMESRLHHVKAHSDDLECGYSGSGPADTALSILCDVLGIKPSNKDVYIGNCAALEAHQQFKRDFVAKWPKEGFKIEEFEIRDWLDQNYPGLADRKS